MSEAIGRGVIEVSADTRKLQAGIDDAKRSIKDLGISATEATKSSSASIDRYVKSLGVQAVTVGKTANETELYKLALRGATTEQIAAASAALRLKDAHEQTQKNIEGLKTGMLAFAAVAVTGTIAAAVAFDELVKHAAEFQHMGEKTGDSAANMASLAVAAKAGGTNMEAVVSASIKLTKGLTGVDDDSKAAGAAIEALGLNLKDFKQLAPADQFEAVAKALADFEDGTQKTAVAVALYGKAGAEMLPFLKQLAEEGGRQKILTDEQIKSAHEYELAQVKLHEQISLYAEAIATEMLPAYNDLKGAFLDLIKDMAGVETGVKGLGNEKGIQEFADSSVKALAFLVDAIDGVFRGFQVLGKTIGGIGAAVVAAEQTHFGQALAIMKEMDADIQATLQRPTLGRLLDDRIAARNAGQAAGATAPPVPTRKVLKFEGAQGDTKAAAAAKAKAQLAFDLDEIKKSSEATIGAYANAQKIMEARRAANLVNDKEYYAAKLGFIQLNSQAQEVELTAEIARMQKESLVGKDKIDNDRKIQDAQAKLAKMRADAVVGIEVNAIQEAAANAKVAQSYVDATEAAQRYLETVTRKNAREIAGIGKGELFRTNQAGLNAIDDKHTAEQQRLATELRKQQIDKVTFDKYLAVADDTYAKEVAAYTARTKDVTDEQANWLNGATEAMQNYIDQSANVAKQTEDLFTGAFKGMEDALVNFVKIGKLDFKALADSIITDLIRIQVRQAIMAPLAQSANGGGGIFGSIASMLGLGGGASSSTTYTPSGGFSGSTPVPWSGEYAEGTDYVPRTGLALVHKGEKITPASQNNGSAGRAISVSNVFYVSGQTDRRSQAQIAAAAGEGVNRALARNT